MQSTQKVYLWTGKVIHVIDLVRPRYPEETDSRRVALCGYKPFWPGEWIKYDPDSTDVTDLTTCKTCERVQGASGERKP